MFRFWLDVFLNYVAGRNKASRFKVQGYFISSPQRNLSWTYRLAAIHAVHYNTLQYNTIRHIVTRTPPQVYTSTSLIVILNR